MVDADVLIGSRSSFSHWAMAIGVGVKVAPSSWLCAPAVASGAPLVALEEGEDPCEPPRAVNSRECVEPYVYDGTVLLLFSFFFSPAHICIATCRAMPMEFFGNFRFDRRHRQRHLHGRKAWYIGACFFVS
jgi:hypothetical protein